MSSFQTKVIVKLATFGFKIAYAGKAPAELQATFIYGSSRQRRVLRASSTLFLLPSRTKTSHGDRTFKKFYATLLNKHNRLRELFVSHSYSDLKKFTTKIFKNNNLIVINFIEIFPKFRFKNNMNIQMKKTN